MINERIQELEKQVKDLNYQIMEYQLHTEYDNGWIAGSSAAWAKCNTFLKDSDNRIEDMRQRKDGAYNERNRLVALLASLFPSSLEPHEGEDWGPDWKWVCVVDLPVGQVSWHVQTSELPLFTHVPREQGRKWDGHTTEDKYRRIEEMCLGLPF